MIDTIVVEAQAVDDGLFLDNAEHPWLGVARLRARRHGTDLDKAETEGGQRVDVFSILVQAGGQADRIAELQPHDLDRVGRRRRGQQAGDPRPVEEVDAGHPQIVGHLGVERKEDIAQQRINHRPILPEAAAAQVFWAQHFWNDGIDPTID